MNVSEYVSPLLPKIFRADTVGGGFITKPGLWTQAAPENDDLGLIGWLHLSEDHFSQNPEAFHIIHLYQNGRIEVTRFIPNKKNFQNNPLGPGFSSIEIPLPKTPNMEVYRGELISPENPDKMNPGMGFAIRITRPPKAAATK